jgi:hypothetical protein
MKNPIFLIKNICQSLKVKLISFQQKNELTLGSNHSFFKIIEEELKSICSLLNNINVHIEQHEPSTEEIVDYFIISRGENFTYNVINSDGKVFCQVNMGEDEYVCETLTKRRAQWIATHCNLGKFLES